MPWRGQPSPRPAGPRTDRCSGRDRRAPGSPLRLAARAGSCKRQSVSVGPSKLGVSGIFAFPYFLSPLVRVEAPADPIARIGRARSCSAAARARPSRASTTARARASMVTAVSGSNSGQGAGTGPSPSRQSAYSPSRASDGAVWDGCPGASSGSVSGFRSGILVSPFGTLASSASAASRMRVNAADSDSSCAAARARSHAARSAGTVQCSDTSRRRRVPFGILPESDTARQRRATNLATCGTSLNEGRGMNSGDTAQEGRRTHRGSPLNEGRGVNPGDTLRATVQQRACHHRSTKAGA